MDNQESAFCPFNYCLTVVSTSLSVLASCMFLQHWKQIKQHLGDHRFKTDYVETAVK